MISDKYPLSKETTHRYARELFSAIERGECATTVWVPMAGRRRLTNFVIDNIQSFEAELPEYRKYVLCYVDPLDLTEESKSGYVRLVGKSFLSSLELHKKLKGTININEYVKEFNDESVGYSRLIDLLKNVLLEVATEGYYIVFFLGEFDELSYVSPVFFGNLKSIWNKLSPKLHFIFLLRGKATKPENIRLWGEELSELVMQNIYYFPILSEIDVQKVLSWLSSEFKTEFLPEETRVVKRLCGGHPYMLKVAARALSTYSRSANQSKTEMLLLDNQELISIGTRIYRRQMDSEKIVLSEIAQGKKVRVIEKDSPVEFLLRMGIIKEDSKGKYKLFGDIFRESILRYERDIGYMQENRLEIDSASGGVLVGKKPAHRMFSAQEATVLKLFLLNESNLVTRDQIGASLWGTDIDKKFSDWAIDQLMSKLRKKIRDLGARAEIVTLRGAGYKFFSSPE